MRVNLYVQTFGRRKKRPRKKCLPSMVTINNTSNKTREITLDSNDTGMYLQTYNIFSIIEDESKLGCGPQEFPCNTTTCIPLSWKCDGREDCANGRDEQCCKYIGVKQLNE